MFVSSPVQETTFCRMCCVQTCPTGSGPVWGYAAFPAQIAKITSNVPLRVPRGAPSALARLRSAPTRLASAPAASAETVAAASELRPDPPVLPADSQCRSAHQRRTRDADYSRASSPTGLALETAWCLDSQPPA